VTNVTKILYFAGVINAEGDLWKSQRRYLLHQKLGMRHWGQGMSQIETRIEHEAALLLDTMYREHHSVAFNPANLVNCAVSNVICSMIMSTRFDSHDPAFQRFMSNFDEGFRLFGMTGSLMWFPWMKILPGIRNSMEKLKSNHQEMLSFVQNIIHAHKLNLDPSNPRDLIDSYLLMIEKIQNDYSNNNEQEETKNIFHGVDPEKQLEQIILDLFSAGVETLKTTVLWSIVYMMYFPEVRKKVQAELDAVVGPTRLPKVKDMPQLTYTKATMYEIMRRSSVVPLGTTHSTERPVELEGYTIPKNAHVIPHLHAVHMDPELWRNPQEFQPERFLNESHSCIEKPEFFMPFGSGQRMCLGDQLAEKEFFLFFTSIMHCFDLENPSGRDLPSLRGVQGVTNSPSDFSVMCYPRNIAALKNSLIIENNFQDSTNLWSTRTCG